MQYIILGLGITGYSCVRFLQSLLVDAKNILVLDTRDNPPCLANLISEYPEIKIIHGDFATYFTDTVIEKIVINNTTIITSPGVDFSQPIFGKLSNKHVKLCSDIEIFARYVRATVVAITGSNGKSTTTSLLGEMARANKMRVAVGGNIGIPVLDLLIDGNNYELYILELSSFQLQFTYSLATRISCILNITDDHLDIHKNFSAYCAAKHRIYLNTLIAVYDQLSPITSPSLVANRISYTDNNQLFDLIPKHNLLGKHNQFNIQAALVMGQALGLATKDMFTAISNFKCLPHRAEKIATINNVLWVNDSKATNVGATIAALDGLKDEINGKWIIILGGKDKGSDFFTLVKPVKKLCKAVVLLGETALQIQALLNSIPNCVVSNMSDAVNKASIFSESGDGVLLAPACASLDMFDNYMHRGDVFAECVNSLKCQEN